MRLYVDASALVKLLVREDGSAEIERLWREAGVVLSATVIYAEARAALAAAGREHRLRPGELNTARHELELRTQALHGVQVDDTLLSVAGDTADAFALRALDAIHLAAALSFATSDLVLATWDARLARASLAAGLAVAP